MEKVTPSSYSIKQIKSPSQVSFEERKSLVDLLKDSVANNYSVGFMQDSTEGDFEKFWIDELALCNSENGIFLAFAGSQVVGSVIVTRELRANGRHRAEFRKLLVHSKAQKMGIGTALERSATSYAKDIGLKLLYLDSATSYLIDGVYEKWGWKKSGEIPNFAKNPDGSLVSTWFFYKLLD
ncbi:MAG: GNAT family N-acetyltransferase [Candidatus Nanopelagicus sp.]